MIFKRKKRKKSTKHGKITSRSQDGSSTPTTYKIQLNVETL